MRMKVDIPFEADEAFRFGSFIKMRGAGKGPFLRQLALTLLDPSTGPIVEAAMRGRSALDLSAGQAQETVAAISESGAMQ